jgi:large subunit ribosomal protein L25
MPEVVLTAEVRTLAGKHAKYTRTQGMVPGVYYARGEKNISIQVPRTSLEPLVFTSEAHVIELRFNEGEAKKCILRDVQFDPVSDKPIHFDLQGLREDEKLTMEIPVVLTGGVPKGVRDGGMVQHFVHKVRVSCLPRDIPQRIEVNVGELGINDFIHVRDLNLGAVTILDNAANAIVGVMPPHVVKEAEVAAPVVEEGAKEPEVVGKGKKPEEGEEGAAAAPAKAEAKEEKKEKK